MPDKPNDETVAPARPLIVLDEDGETMLWQCNNCGVLVPAFDDMCGPCYEEQCNAEFWEMCHPEVRCPPRE